MKFTKDQTEAIKAIAKWIKDNKTKSFCLSGRAGTGKTFLTRYIVNNMLKGKSVTVSAYTHKAVRVVSKFAGIPGHTIHSLHGLRINYDLDTMDLNKVKFEATGTPKFDRYDYIIMDESSMIGDSLLTLNDTRSLQFNTKIIYVGDSLQLPPVTKDNNKLMKISTVFSLADRFELNDIVRQDNDSKLLPLLELCREDILNNSSKTIHKVNQTKDSLNDGFGYYTAKFAEFSNIVARFFTSDRFNKDINFARIAGFTNDKVDAWNAFIRKGLFETEDIITVGDKLMGYETIVDSFAHTLIINSNDYLVDSVVQRVSDDGFAEFVTGVRELGTDRFITISIVNHKDPSFINFINSLQARFRTALFADSSERGMKWRQYFEYKAQHLTMIGFPLFPDDARLKGYIKKSLGYAYAVTTHKLQGSTIRNIFVDFDDMVYYPSGGKRKNNERFPNTIQMRNRLIYTALSRASHKAIILVK